MDAWDLLVSGMISVVWEVIKAPFKNNNKTNTVIDNRVEYRTTSMTIAIMVDEVIRLFTYCQDVKEPESTKVLIDPQK